MTFNKIWRLFLMGLLLIHTSFAQQKENGVLFNFQDTDIEAIVKTVAQLTGSNFLVDPRLKGKKVTVISTQSVSSRSAYQIFLSVLKGQGMAAVKGPGGVIKIVPENAARFEAGVRTNGTPPNSGEWITQIVPVQHASASQLNSLFAPLLEPTAKMVVYNPTNTLIITGPAANVRRMVQVIQNVDQPGELDVQVIPLQHASAPDVAQLINKFPGNQSIQDNRLSVVPDLRTNSLLVRADNKARFESIQSLVLKIDVPAKEGQARVIYLRHASAPQMAEVLKGLVKQQNAPSSLGLNNPNGAKDKSVVQADEATNALIVNAPDGTYNNLRTIVEKLDIPRAQIFVEALIAEVTTTKASQFGVRWFGGEEVGEGVVAGALNLPSFGAITDPVQAITTPSGLSVGFLGESITLDDGRVISGLSGLARALEQDADVNILSTPNLLTLDNAEAKILIGQNVPFLTGRFTVSEGGSDPFQTIERKDIGLTLQLKPQISEGGDILLQIFQESSSVVQASSIQAQDIITNKRTLETTVLVENGNTVVLGGLIQDTVTENVDAIPILSKIPLIGELFKFRSRRKEKINLMVFLKPQIINKPRDAYQVTLDRYEYIRAQEKDSKMDFTPFLFRFDPPVLPEWDGEPIPTDAAPVEVEKDVENVEEEGEKETD